MSEAADFSNAFMSTTVAPAPQVDAPPNEVLTLRVRLDRTGQVVDVVRYIQEIKDPQFPKTTVAEVQGFPVMLGWACTIQKLQGMTLHELVVDMQSIMHHPLDSRHGLAYVAFSRVRTLEGLHLTSWNDAAIYCDPRLKHLL